MSQKQEKKQRKFFRKTFNEEIIKKADFIAEQHMKLLKEKPKLVPMFLWIVGLETFVRINRTGKESKVFRPFVLLIITSIFILGIVKVVEIISK